MTELEPIEQKVVNQELLERAEKFLLNIEEDCIHSAKSQFNASARYNSLNLVLGICSVVASAVAGCSYLADMPLIAAGISFLVALLAGLMTFLKPNETAASHKRSGDQYLAIRNDSKHFRQLGLLVESDPTKLIETVDEISKRRDDLNQVSLQPTKSDFKRAKIGIDAGEATYRTEVA